MDLLARDEATEILVLVSKPPDPEVAARLLAATRATGKPTVVCFLGRLAFASDLDDAAELAARLAPALEEIRATRDDDAPLQVVAVVVGTDEDPQDRPAQIERFQAAGVRVFPTVPEAASSAIVHPKEAA